MQVQRRVAVFGASFDPPTSRQGHAGIVAYFAQRFDLVLVLPVYVHPLVKSKRVQTPFETRMDMARLALGNLGSNVLISDAEKVVKDAWARAERDEVPGTMDILEWLAANELAGAAISFVLGADTYADLLHGKWRRAEDLLRAFQLCVVNRCGVAGGDGANGQLRLGGHRPGFDPGVPLPAFAKGVHMFDVPGLGPVSSTLARATSDRATLEKICGQDVARYVCDDKHLYMFQTKL
jgi:nicotinic acid mononucleotide adenylyltransferase